MGTMRRAVFAGSAATVFLLTTTACGGSGGSAAQDHHAMDHGAAAAPHAISEKAPSGPATVQQIATALGCTAEITIDATELRQGACRTKQDQYRMVTFAVDQGQRAWLTEAQMYGGIYLVGTRWVVTARSADSLRPLREKLGGTIWTGSVHGSGHSSADMSHGS